VNNNVQKMAALGALWKGMVKLRVPRDVRQAIVVLCWQLATAVCKTRKMVCHVAHPGNAWKVEHCWICPVLEIKDSALVWNNALWCNNFNRAPKRVRL
jgi:hypothetical protein